MSARAEDVRFIADSMLGRLAKRLRMLGVDVVYEPFIDDQGLIERALAENRVILTRDTQMLRRRLDRPRVIFITRDHVAEQLAQVVRELDFALDKEGAFTRCLVCNGRLEAVAKESVREQVPPYVFQTQERFVRCAGCGRIYWRGTHVAGMERTLGGSGLR